MPAKSLHRVVGASVLGATLGAVLGVASAYFGGTRGPLPAAPDGHLPVLPAHHPGAGAGGDPRNSIPNLVLAIMIR